MKKIFWVTAILILPLTIFSQTGVITGTVQSSKGQLPYVNIIVKDSQKGTTSDSSGAFYINEIPFGEHTLLITYTGFLPHEESFELTKEKPTVKLQIELQPNTIWLDQIVITGTKTFQKQTESPIMVNVIDHETLQQVQACNLSDGLKFQPGLRVETDCQTCNYTQLRMNGLGGSYAQILINGRPIFSPLTGLYGMEQVPASMIDRIEIVRGGGSALYGSSAIGGTANVITKIPDENFFEVGYTFNKINQQSDDQVLRGIASLLSQKGNAGMSLFVNHRNRAWYDHNSDGFSELPAIKNNSFGSSIFLLPSPDQKIELSFSSLQEYRYGGEMVDNPAHLAQQSEERNHQVFLGNIDYQVNFNRDRSSFISYFAGQHTDRTHYTGILPDNPLELEAHYKNPPYGFSENTTFQGGIQLNHRISLSSASSAVLTFGGEYVQDKVLDIIEAYGYEVDQVTQNLGLFIQSDWSITPSITLLTGVRADNHNLVDQLIASPRVSVLFKLKPSTQFRLTWGTGFRAPQAFDADLHIAFAGGGVSRISLADHLKAERSNSFSGSINYDKASADFIAGFTLEGFITNLSRAFYLHPLGMDSFGERFEKRNGGTASVMGGTLELRANYNRQIQLEAGFTLQSSEYDQPVTYIEGLSPVQEFLRTPNQYGYASLFFTPSSPFSISVNLIYTGPMDLVHFAGAPEQLDDAYIRSSSFAEIGFRSAYAIPLDKAGAKLELFAGAKNLGNAYQSDFDSGKNRDSNYVYGPGSPRTLFLGFLLSSL